VKVPSGNSAVTFRRLLAHALDRDINFLSIGRRAVGISIERRPER
jgi:hypothetical protein